MLQEVTHINTGIDITGNHGTYLGTSTCSCGEKAEGKQEYSVLMARRSAEDAWRKHREFREMHVGLFEDLP